MKVCIITPAGEDIAEWDGTPPDKGEWVVMPDESRWLVVDRFFRVTLAFAVCECTAVAAATQQEKLEEQERLHAEMMEYEEW